MLLIHVPKVTSRVEYTFRFLLTSILGVKIKFTSDVVKFTAHREEKISYGENSLVELEAGQTNEANLFFPAHSLLFERKISKNIKLEVELVDDVPYFFRTERKGCAMRFDIFAATFYLISRYEEYLPYMPDDYQRFPSKESLAYKNNFIRKPVVDIWAMRLLKILKEKFPRLDSSPRSFKFINVFSISRAWAYRGIGFLRNFSGAAEELLCSNFGGFSNRMATIFGRRPDPFDTYDEIIRYHKKYQLDSIFFFLVERCGRNVSIYDPDFRELIKFMADDVKIGLCASYASTRKFKLLVEEKKRMENILHYPVTRSLQHLIKLNLPRAYRDLIELNIQEDYSMGFPDHIGFRAGTCTPFFFYDLENEVWTPLKVFPFSASISALKHYMKLSMEESQEELLDLMQEVKAVQGVYISIMNNRVLSDEPDWRGWKEVYETVLNNGSR